jgi:hypothetical protein
MMNKPKLTINLSGPLWLLGTILIVLKITNHLTWSWGVILAPFWFPPALVLGVLGLMVVISFISYMLNSRRHDRNG